MDLAVVVFAIVSGGVLSALCLLVLEYQNGRTRRLSGIWADRVRALPDPDGKAVLANSTPEDSRAA